jgi:hypothetical protein
VINAHRRRADDLGIDGLARGAGSMEKTVALRLMMEIHVGDLVTYEGRVLRVRGISPMSASPRRVLLEDVDTGEDIEAPLEELEPYIDDRIS